MRKLEPIPDYSKIHRIPRAEFWGVALSGEKWNNNLKRFVPLETTEHKIPQSGKEKRKKFSPA
jgi:hypothetical protein